MVSDSTVHVPGTFIPLHGGELVVEFDPGTVDETPVKVDTRSRRQRDVDDAIRTRQSQRAAKAAREEKRIM